MLQIGDKMPSFQVMDQDGNLVRSEDLAGKKTIIYFYPKDNTSGCTAEACSFRDNYAELTAAGYNVIGVSLFWRPFSCTDRCNITQYFAQYYAIKAHKKAAFKSLENGLSCCLTT